MPGERVSCTSTARGPLVTLPVDESSNSSPQPIQEDMMITARVGKPAPDFEAMGYIDGGFKRYKLSDYAGQWVLVCFYPGDFTFV